MKYKINQFAPKQSPHLEIRNLFHNYKMCVVTKNTSHIFFKLSHYMRVM